MKIVVTGAFGFIGSEFVKKVYESDMFSEIVLIDKMTYAADPIRIPIRILNDERVVFYQDDICDVTYEMLGDFEYLVNFAAETHVDNSIADGRPFLRTNVEGVYNLIEVAKQSQTLIKFVQISTDEVYGDAYEKFCTDENAPLQPSSYYSATKASADHLVLSAHRTYGLPYLITRSCNNFGILQHSEKFIPKVIECLTEDKEIPVYGDGQQKRIWISAEENSDIIFKLMVSPQVNEIFNVGSYYDMENLEVIEVIASIMNKTPKIKFVEDRLGHDIEYNLDLNKLESVANEIDVKVHALTSLRDYFQNNLT